MSTYATRLVRRLIGAMHPRHRAASPDRANDPFADPRLRNMTLSELADIPFDRQQAPEGPLAERAGGCGSASCP